MAAPFVLICEHASAHIPDEFDGLGLSEADRHSHAAWDPGASAIVARLATVFNAPSVEAEVSRLVHDCNRPPAASTACPVRSDQVDVPGNRDLSDAQRADRAARFHEPFHQRVEALLARHPDAPVVTMHSFNPTWAGAPRRVEIGLLYDGDDRLARRMHAHAPAGVDVRLNDPYSPVDGVTYTIRRHATPENRPHVMIEVRNDLIRDAPGQERFAHILADMLTPALADLANTQTTTPELTASAVEENKI